ncbi:YkgJ family cysteine cluster protein [Oryzomonas sagensis]|uniref:YkgJ family cysteine cluster protein n=1 Tax=Oryzomonas sagensis TaxID=2603857 RepID=A0ABQ6TNH3_9BACT|nr:YkgJ family cysteine cluster protein [Oryzomonas sagensis]KAB0669773.1 YkgJ family cysteine cluster protein [Oryzomonas sagensis]
MKELLGRYGALLREVDRWFDGCIQRHGDQIACHRGCSACCRGLFDITVLDALYLRSGIDALPEAVQCSLRQKATERLASLSACNPSFVEPWILNRIPEEEWEELMPEEDETPCLLLAEDGSCLVYEHRPMTCRLNGIPLLDTSGEALMDEWCTLNFTGIDVAQLEDLRHPFLDLFAQELLLFRELTRRLLGDAVNELDTFIPAAVVLDAGMIGALRRK